MIETIGAKEEKPFTGHHLFSWLALTRTPLPSPIETQPFYSRTTTVFGLII